MNTYSVINKQEYGVVSFDTLARFENPNMGLSDDEIYDRMLPIYLNMDSDRPKPQPLESTACWPKVTKAIKRGDTFVIEAKHLSESLFLRFDPKKLSESYFIVRRHKEVYEGSIEKLVSDASIESDIRLCMLIDFSTKFCLMGRDYRRPNHRFVWKVGLKDYEIVEDHSED
jgi:hypothetical protein